MIEVLPRHGDWIQTASGRKFWPLDARCDEVRIDDVAHALANVCRFTGHCRDFYSVAQHSVLASLNVPRESALAALLHDAAEAYMGDIARPWKRFLYVNTGTGDAVYRRLKDAEHRLLDVILEAFRCPPRTDSAVWTPVEAIDMRMLATEARDLMKMAVNNWDNTFQDGFNPLAGEIEPWTPLVAKATFLKRFADLQ